MEKHLYYLSRSEQSSGQRKALDYEKYNLDIKFYLNEIYNELSKIVFIIPDLNKLKQLLIKYYEILKTKTVDIKSPTQSVGRDRSRVISNILNMKNIIIII